MVNFHFSTYLEIVKFVILKYCAVIGCLLSSWSHYLGLKFKPFFRQIHKFVFEYSYLLHLLPRSQVQNKLSDFNYIWMVKIRLLPTRIISSSELEIKSFVISKHFWSNFEFGIFCDISWGTKLLKKSLYCCLLNDILCELCSTYLSIFLLVSFQARDKILLLFKTFSIKQFMTVFNVILRQYWL